MQPLLSICLPTCNRPKLVNEAIESILQQGVSAEKYEIVVSDDSEGDETEEVLKKYLDLPNFKYQHVKHITSFMNLDLALSMGSGMLLKLINDYSLFQNGHLEKMLELIDEHKQNKDQLIFSLGTQKFQGVREYDSFDSMLYELGYWETWVGNFSIWSEDYKKLKEENYQINSMFPHTSILHYCSNKTCYVIDNEEHIKSQELGKKGGYNLPETFGANYLAMDKDLLDKDIISERTFQKIRSDIMHFIAGWDVTVRYQPEKFTFKFDNKYEYLSKVYSPEEIKEYDKLVKQAELKHKAKKLVSKFRRKS